MLPLAKYLTNLHVKLKVARGNLEKSAREFYNVSRGKFQKSAREAQMLPVAKQINKLHGQQKVSRGKKNTVRL